MLISFYHMWAWRHLLLILPVHQYGEAGFLFFFYVAKWCTSKRHICRSGSVMHTLMVLVRLIPHCRHTWLWCRDPRYNINNWLRARVHCGPFTVFWNWHLGEENPPWYLSRQPIIIPHLRLLIVRSFPAVQAQVGGLWLQVQAGLSWPWDTQEVQLRPPRQWHAVAADQTEHGARPGNQIQRRLSWVCWAMGDVVLGSRCKNRFLSTK